MTSILQHQAALIQYAYIRDNTETLMTQNTLLFSGILALCFSCSAQSDQGTLNDPIVARGDTVSATHDSILVVFQDSRDHFWFGSNGAGVYRYDGKALVRFSTKDGLCHDQVREIKEDRSGNVYINTRNGISKFDGKTFATLRVSEDPSDNQWQSQPGDLWFKGRQEENGPYRYDGKTLSHPQFPKHYLEDDFYARLPNAPYNPYEVYTVYTDSKGMIWFGTSTFGVCRYDGSSLSWMYEKELTQIGDEGSFGIRSILEDRKGTFWFCNTHYRYDVYPKDTAARMEHETRMFAYDRGPGMRLPKDRSEDKPIYFMSIVEDNSGDLWMATYGEGIWRYDGKRLTNYRIKDGDAAVTVFAIYKDKQGDLWLATHTAGAYKFNGKTFEQFRF